jgi:DNA-binding transcriptional LysR family regulator
MRVLSLSKLKAFQLAGMTGSFKHAAHLLSISPSAVSARVRSLESDLGVRLFQRGIRKLTLTEAGVIYIREVEATFVSFDMATRDLCNRFGPPEQSRSVA